ncbi:hypothetical protein GNI_089040 [Gregarina niphandrodes]|uniref:Uncharacterized protein n=1 Tax=Gregarina niphandrodes TaxID=110365 RepID=A0A023B5Q7_GRENI|nr:hypothetical protein GNI_089040 [Gregarina niphandrodes]EZG61404.1 hypothetical protein GNI_089040 [Gregarina niphandrodes]|eukprot:XP_011130764.1 hypothetical protein GNI_089040 [Gregarina niphandrodes]
MEDAIDVLKSNASVYHQIPWPKEGVEFTVSSLVNTSKGQANTSLSFNEDDQVITSVPDEEGVEVLAPGFGRYRYCLDHVRKPSLVRTRVTMIDMNPSAKPEILKGYRVRVFGNRNGQLLACRDVGVLESPAEQLQITQQDTTEEEREKYTLAIQKKMRKLDIGAPKFCPLDKPSKLPPLARLGPPAKMLLAGEVVHELFAEVDVADFRKLGVNLPTPDGTISDGATPYGTTPQGVTPQGVTPQRITPSMPGDATGDQNAQQPGPQQPGQQLGQHNNLHVQPQAAAKELGQQLRRERQELQAQAPAPRTNESVVAVLERAAPRKEFRKTRQPRTRDEGTPPPTYNARQVVDDAGNWLAKQIKQAAGIQDRADVFPNTAPPLNPVSKETMSKETMSNDLVFNDTVFDPILAVGAKIGDQILYAEQSLYADQSLYVGRSPYADGHRPEDLDRGGGGRGRRGGRGGRGGDRGGRGGDRGGRGRDRSGRSDDRGGRSSDRGGRSSDRGGRTNDRGGRSGARGGGRGGRAGAGAGDRGGEERPATERRTRCQQHQDRGVANYGLEAKPQEGGPSRPQAPSTPATSARGGSTRGRGGRPRGGRGRPGRS